MEPEKALYLILQEIRRRTDTQGLDYFYPDKGSLRRELYVKHTAMLAAGAIHQERVALGGNRCISPWTKIQTPHGERRILDIPVLPYFDVLSWDGASQCVQQASGVILKGIEPMIRFQTDTGFFDCSRKHRVLTRDGWVSADQLVYLLSGRHWSDITLDSMANYDKACGLYDRWPLVVTGNDRSQLPSKDGVQTLSRLDSVRQDEEERKSQYTHAYPQLDRPSNLDDLSQIVALCEQFSAPDEQQLSQQLIYIPPERQHICAELAPQSLLDAEVSDHQFSLQACANPRVCNGSRILSIVPIGYQPVLDLTVENTHCYYAGGVVHHNSGKSTSIGGYETALHLTGLYPHWWEGKTYNKPILAWTAGTKAIKTRDTNQKILLGKLDRSTGVTSVTGGLIPAYNVIRATRKTGVADALDQVEIRHKGGWTNILTFKSYEEGRTSFESEAVDWIWLDEEPPKEIYDECKMRLITTRGSMLSTFTPLQGMTECVMSVLEGTDLL